MRMGKDSQCSDILAHLQKYGSITPQEAISKYGCTRLGARIWDLRRAGYDITTTMETGTNRRGHRVAYARYYLIQREAQK